MFHVAPLLPFQAADLQRVERKRHLGNDVVNIVFHEDYDNPFDPLWLSSHVNRECLLSFSLTLQTCTWWCKKCLRSSQRTTAFAL
jgi:hypothetical protein